MELVFFEAFDDQEHSKIVEVTKGVLQGKGLKISAETQKGVNPEQITTFCEQIVNSGNLGVIFTTDGTFHSILTNKVKGIRAALAYSSYEGGMTRKVFLFLISAQQCKHSCY